MEDFLFSDGNIPDMCLPRALAHFFDMDRHVAGGGKADKV